MRAWKMAVAVSVRLLASLLVKHLVVLQTKNARMTIMRSSFYQYNL